MKKHLTLLIGLLISNFFYAQTFTSSTAELNNEYHSGGCVGVTDMDNNGYDDIIILDQSKNLYIEYQDDMGNYNASFIGIVSGSSQWGMAVGDFNNDGHNDVISGGYYDGLNIATIISPDSFSLSNNPEYGIFMQGLSFGDINNDGWLDALGCHDHAESAIWGNDGAGNLDIQNSWIDMATTPSSDNSGNYGSVFCDIDNDGDLDLYLAKCRQGVNEADDPRRINALFINDGNNNYTEEAFVRGLAPHHQSWTSDFMDLDNDGDFDCFLTNHDHSLMVLENDGNGYFADTTSSSGLQDYEGFFLQGKFADFDNDGYVDLLTSGGYGAANLFHNNGDFTFSVVEVTFNDDDQLHSFGIGDLNHDGSLDFYASYGNSYVSPDYNHEDMIWFNDGNANNWVSFQLEGTLSNASAIGSKVKIYGDWGVQVREVRGGESYGITNTFAAHFGIGSSTAIDSVAIEWPEGGTTTIQNPAINQFHEVIESEFGQIALNLSVLLEGNYDEDTGLMNDNLRVGGNIPLVEPYSDLGFTHVQGGGESMIQDVLNSTGDFAVVDWIFVELRDPADSTLVIATQSALLLRNGSIVDVDGSSLVTFEGLNVGEVYIVLRHRNHFGVRTLNVYPTAETISIDLSNDMVDLYGNNPMNIIANLRVLIAGDANSDGQVNPVDKNDYWRLENGQPYNYSTTKADFNMDGVVNPVDKNALWRLNNSKVEQLD